MVAKKPNQKNTKAEILQAYNELAKEKALLKAEYEQKLQVSKANNINTPISNEVPVKNSKTNQSTEAQQKMNSTIESLSKIQLGFGSAINELSDRLTKKASNLGEIQEAVENELQELKQLYNLTVTENTLDSLIQSYNNNSKSYQEEFSQLSERLLEEIEAEKNTWNKEQDEHNVTVQERNNSLNRNRRRDDSEYKYNLDIQRTLEKEEYEQQQAYSYQELEELQQESEKTWEERENTISEQEKEFEEYKSKVEAFPSEKQAAIKKATELGKGIAQYQARVKSDLYATEVEGQKNFYEQRLQSLENTISNQQERIVNLSEQLESALQQVQDLAVKAIEGNANLTSYQAMKEIALEQAKVQGKTK
ncbi:hypothetical protein [Mastigocoleus testarum]|uniref:Myosin heavy chain n=1 Tax=Mastigocoleus testarum BC008 TaxID=371196 RepID=A0A0V7ZXC4_9CYAN|nr:hypothetical protein [Mastigocoleus testarum]KST63711.1 hypothetical protein BC008_14735 [Mastigocoleus testarum BC008]KST69225.1 hypothetical protein BC008_03280 [Mastigocoleus testarum BC008]